jgi:predicted nucleic acid-binding protein
MVAVSNTSPISNLAITGRLALLRSQFSQILIPAAVRTELERMPNPEAKALIEAALRDGWLLCRAVGNRQFAAALGNDLDQGEAEAIALATEIQAGVLLIDEKEGRSFARQAGLMVRGVLGVLIRAKTMGEIASVRAEIDALRNRAGFFIAPSLESEVLSSVGE